MTDWLSVVLCDLSLCSVKTGIFFQSQHNSVRKRSLERCSYVFVLSLNT